MEYQKINTLYKRDDKNCIIPCEYSCDEFFYLRNSLWHCEEKIDGTNIRIEVTWQWDGDGGYWRAHKEFKGRTDRAQIPAHLLKFLKEKYTDDLVYDALGINDCYTNSEAREKWGNDTPPEFTIYGEGFGVKIQSGGAYLHDSVDFIIFDVRVGKWWLSIDDRDSIAVKLCTCVCPYIGTYDLKQAEELVRDGFISRISEDRKLIAEGLVLRPLVQLFNRKGERIITKMKHKDFEQLIRTYA